MRRSRSLLLAVLLVTSPSVARAQSSDEPLPGFGRDAAAQEEDDDDEDEDRRRVSAEEAGRNERLIRQMNQAHGRVSLVELIEEIMGDVVLELGRRRLKSTSPMAIRQVTLGRNISPQFSQKLKNLIMSSIHAGTKVRMVRCIECDATRTRIENRNWVITRGIVTSDELREVGDRLGVETFLDVAFNFDPRNSALELDFQLVRARDAHILWANSYYADHETPLLLRSSDGPMRREDRLKDFEMLLEGRPLYGYVASAGFALIPYDDPIDGDITGPTAGYRIFERFGTDRRVMFGLDLMGFLNTERLAGAILSAGSWWVPLPPDFIFPELRIGAKAGAFIAGTEGNAAVFQTGAEVILRYRFGLYFYVLYMTKSQFQNNDLGGVGMSTGISFNW